MNIKKILLGLTLGVATLISTFHSAEAAGTGTITVSSEGEMSDSSGNVAYSGEYRTKNPYGVKTDRKFKMSDGNIVTFDPRRHGFYQCLFCSKNAITEIANKARHGNEKPFTNSPNWSEQCPKHGNNAERNHNDFSDKHEWIWITGVPPIKQVYLDYLCADCLYRVRVAYDVDRSIHPPIVTSVKCTVNHYEGHADHRWVRLPIIRRTNEFHVPEFPPPMDYVQGGVG